MQVHLVSFAILPLCHSLFYKETCSAEDAQICGRCTNIGCVDQKNNFIGSFTNVSSVDECHEWCTRRNEYMNDCNYLTYFGNNGHPYENTCYIFSLCPKKVEGTGCVTEAKDCYRAPTSKVTTAKTTLLTTQTTASTTTTHHTTTPTSTTTTPKPCIVQFNGTQVKHHKFEHSGNEETLEISGNMGCHLRVLAVGGGGLRGYAYPNILL